MWLANLNIVGLAGQYDILIENGRISKINPTNASIVLQKPKIHFEEAIIFPGIINSHDHLDFNLFPQLGSGIYPSYREWAEDIHRRNKDIIERISRIPETLRARWGMYKNLLTGVTTVVNHGKRLALPDEFIAVLQSARSLHSLAGEKNWKWKMLDPFAGNQPVVLHIGEGSDESVGPEISTFKKWNILRRKIIAVHGVAMKEEEAGAFKALIWCPASNVFMLGRTAGINKLKNYIPILFGTDSTLTASWNLWEQLRLARSLQMLNDVELFQSLTSMPAATWNLTGLGKLEENFQADLVIAKKNKHNTGWDAFYSINPENILLIIQNGNIRLFDKGIYAQLKDLGLRLENFSSVELNNTTKFVNEDLPALMEAIRKYDPTASFPVVG